MGAALLAALACTGAAPVGDELVEPARLDPTIRLDLRYATSENFTGTPVYPAARCWLRRYVAERLVRVQQRLRHEGLGLLLWDCYRPFSVQRAFWDRVPDARYVAEPVVRDGVPVEGSKHNRGAAVDLTLVDAEGRPLPMPTDFDDFSARANRDAGDAPAEARANRSKLEAAMVSEGFLPLPTEWWHFDGPGWERYGILDRPLDP